MHHASRSPKTTDHRLRPGVTPGGSIAAPPLTSVRDLLSPIRQVLWGTQSLEEAALRLDAEGEAVVVLNLSARPMGLLTKADVDLLAQREPKTWRRKRCACLMPASLTHLQLSDSLEDVIACCQSGRITPLLVFDGGQAVGIIYPSTVSQWCADHHPQALEALSGCEREAPTHRN